MVENKVFIEKHGSQYVAVRRKGFPNTYISGTWCKTKKQTITETTRRGYKVIKNY